MPKKIMVFVGEKEVLRDDILNIVNAMKTDGKVDVQLIQERYVHDWFMLREVIKKKDKDMIKKYDKLFADFAVEAVKESQRSLQQEQQHPQVIVNESASSKYSETISETIDVNQLVIGTGEQKRSPIVLGGQNNGKAENFLVSSDVDKNISNITAKIDEPFELFENTKFPKPVQRKPNTILSEYAIFTDRPSKNAASL